MSTVITVMLDSDNGWRFFCYAIFRGKVINSPSTLSHEDRYLPNAWVVTAKPKQK